MWLDNDDKIMDILDKFEKKIKNTFQCVVLFVEKRKDTYSFIEI